MLVAWREVGARMFRPPGYPLVLLRGTVMCSAYTSYVTAMVAMPLAIPRSISRFRCRRPAQVGPLMHRFDCSAIIVDGSKKQSPGSRASGDFSTLTSLPKSALSISTILACFGSPTYSAFIRSIYPTKSAVRP